MDGCFSRLQCPVCSQKRARKLNETEGQLQRERSWQVSALSELRRSQAMQRWGDSATRSASAGSSSSSSMSIALECCTQLVALLAVCSDGIAFAALQSCTNGRSNYPQQKRPFF